MPILLIQGILVFLVPSSSVFEFPKSRCLYTPYEMRKKCSAATISIRCHTKAEKGRRADIILEEIEGAYSKKITQRQRKE